MQIRQTPMDEGTRLELYKDDKTLSGLGVYDRDIRIEDQVVRLGGIGGVGTPPEHRMKGYARRVLDASITFMRDKGYPLSALYGIPNFYTRWGFAPALPESRATIKTRDAELAAARLPVRQMTPDDATAAAALYAKANATRTGTVVRPQNWSGFKRGPGNRFATFVVEQEGNVVGYAMYTLDASDCIVGEIGYRDGSVWSTILAEISQIAWERRLEKLTIMIPPDDPFLTYCQRYGYSLELSYARNAHGMARVIDQDALIEELAPLLRRRAAKAGLSPAGSLVFNTDLGQTRLELGSANGTLHVRLPQWALAQLVLGYRGIDDILFESEAHADLGAIPVLRAIFPQGFPYTYVADRY
ncbi:MAG: GNAT family N-acetyltransferase [Anaerolineae bacterium]